MKKFVLLICSLVVIFSCVTTAYAWPVSLTPEALAQLGLNLKFNGESIAVLVCDPFDAYLNGNECREVSYSALSDLRDRLVKQSFDVRLQKGFKSDYYYLAFYDRFDGTFKGCIGDAGLASCNVYRALDPSASTAHTIKEIAGTGIYWIDSTDLSSLNAHYVDSTSFDNITRKLHYNVRDQYMARAFLLPSVRRKRRGLPVYTPAALSAVFTRGKSSIAPCTHSAAAMPPPGVPVQMSGSFASAGLCR